MKELVNVEHKGIRVLTTEQLAEAYGCQPNNIKQNFNASKHHFEEGKHFFRLEGQDLKAFKNEVRNSNLVGKNASCLYLWTRRGASRHCKMLGTERAWDMFDVLEENYFNPRPKELTPAEQMAVGLIAAQKLLEEKEAKIAELTPKAEFYDTVANSESLLSMGDVAKTLDMGVGRNKLYKFLRDKNVLMDNNIPYQKYVDAGYFKAIEGHYMAGDNSVVSTTTYVKQKGVDYIRKLLTKNKAVTNIE